MGQRPAAGGHIHPPPPPPLRADCFSRGAESGRGATGSRASTYSVLTTRSRAKPPESRAKSAVTTEVPTPNEPQLTSRVSTKIRYRSTAVSKVDCLDQRQSTRNGVPETIEQTLGNQFLLCAVQSSAALRQCPSYMTPTIRSLNVHSLRQSAWV